MGREIYTSLSGAAAAWRQVELVSNNLANISTHGFRAAHVGFSLDGEGGLGSTCADLGEVRFDLADGTLMQDGVATHLALRGDAFFALQDGSYTRDGAFRVDEGGQLVTQHGTPVLGDGGPLQIDPTERFTVGPDGVVVGEESGEIGRLQLMRLDAPQPLGGGRWTGTASPAEGVRVIQGALEGSNVDPLRGMAELIEASRYFEAQQKLMQTSDEMHERLNRMGGS